MKHKFLTVSLTLIIVISSFVQSFANPLIVGEVAVATVAEAEQVSLIVKSLGFGALVQAIPSLIQNMLPSLSLSGIKTGLLSDGTQVMLTDKQMIQQVYEKVCLQTNGYGTTSLTSNVLDSVYTNYSNWFTDSLPSYTCTNPISYYNSITAQPYKLWVWSVSNNYNAIYTSATKFTFSGSGSSVIINGSNMYRYLYNRNNLDSQSVWDGGIGMYNSNTDRVAMMNCKYGTQAIDPAVWNSTWTTPTTVNYTNWNTQPNGDVAIRVPVTRVGDVATVSDADIASQTTAITRVSDLATVVDPVTATDPQTYTPVVPVTDPITDPAGNVATDTLFDRFISKVIDLFVLPDDYWTNNFDKLKNHAPTGSTGYTIISDLEAMTNESQGTIQDITMTKNGHTYVIVSFQALRDSLPTFHNWVRGIFFILLLFFNYKMLYRAITGNDYTFSTGRNDGELSTTISVRGRK